MSTPVEPLRLLLLADEPEWAALLRECLAPMGEGAVLISAPNWDSVSRLFDDDQGAVLLTTPSLQPGPGRCSLPCVLLLEQEPLLEWLDEQTQIPYLLKYFADVPTYEEAVYTYHYGPAGPWHCLLPELTS